MEKAFLKLLVFLVYLYGCIWVFNHVNAWLSFGMVAAMIYFLLNQTKQKKNETN